EISGVGDFNGNGTSDILWQNKSNGYVGDWESGTNWQSLGGTGTDWEVAGIGDFNGNGTSDILWRNKQDGFTGMWESGTDWQALGGASNDWKICIA
ncbi:MAG: VCBS repeat-containing protein, partial [Victivallaceae bacterium]